MSPTRLEQGFKLRAKRCGNFGLTKIEFATQSFRGIKSRSRLRRVCSFARRNRSGVKKVPMFELEASRPSAIRLFGKFQTVSPRSIDELTMVHSLNGRNAAPGHFSLIVSCVRKLRSVVSPSMSFSSTIAVDALKTPRFTCKVFEFAGMSRPLDRGRD